MGELRGPVLWARDDVRPLGVRRRPGPVRVRHHHQGLRHRREPRPQGGAGTPCTGRPATPTTAWTATADEVVKRARHNGQQRRPPARAPDARPGPGRAPDGTGPAADPGRQPAPHLPPRAGPAAPGRASRWAPTTSTRSPTSAPAPSTTCSPPPSQRVEEVTGTPRDASAATGGPSPGGPLTYHHPAAREDHDHLDGITVDGRAPRRAGPLRRRPDARPRRCSTSERRRRRSVLATGPDGRRARRGARPLRLATLSPRRRARRRGRRTCGRGRRSRRPLDLGIAGVGPDGLCEEEVRTRLLQLARFFEAAMASLLHGTAPEARRGEVDRHHSAGPCEIAHPGREP